MATSNLGYIHEALDAGLSLSTWDERGQERRFVKGQITDQRSPKGGVRTTHSNGSTYVWLTKAGIAQLAAQAKGKLARKDELLAERERSIAAFLDR